MNFFKTSRTYSFGLMLAIAGTLISIVTVGVSPQAQNSCVMQPADIAAWYPGDGNTTDILHGSNGTPQGNTSYAAGQAGQAFSFDGVNSSVSIGNPTSLQLQDLTIEAWVKRGSSTVVTLDPISGGFGSIFAYGLNGYALFIGDDGHLSFHKPGVISNTFSTGLGNFPDLKITDTNFHHVAVTKSGKNVTFYLDGVMSHTQFFGSPFEFTSNANIGAFWYNNSIRYSFLGLIDELSIYKRALNQSDIQAIFNAGAAGKCKATSVQFEFATYPSGSASGTETVKVTRTGDTSSVSSVDYATSDGTAKAGKNYTSTSGTLNFASGEQSRTITVPILNNAATTTDTNFQLALSNTAGTTLGATSSATLNIFAIPNGPGRVLLYRGDLYSSYLQAVNLDGSNTFQLTAYRGGTHVDFPSVSRLTGVIAFQGCGEFLPTGTTCEHGRRIYVMNSDGSGFRQVTTDAGLDSPPYQNDDRPIISPDGTKIAFISGRPPANNARPEVFVVNTDGTGLHQITTHQNVQNLGESDAISVVWSPDSQKLLVHARRLDKDDNGNQTLGMASLFTYNADGTGEKLFLRRVLNSTMALDWSPDGRSILYASIGGPASNTYGYVILDALNPDKSSYLGGAQLGATGDDYYGYQLSGTFPGSVRFSPDGQKIVYGDHSHRSIRTINLDGTNMTSAIAPGDSFYYAKWWWPGAAIPQPDHLTLTPNVVTVYGTEYAQVTPTLYDKDNNVIFHSADFSGNYTTGILCYQHPCSGNAWLDSRVTGSGLVYNINSASSGVLTLCGANAGFNTCTLVAINFESIGVGTATPVIRKSGADGAGVFNFTRRSNPNSTSSSQLVQFALGGAAVNGTDYYLTDTSGNRINGTTFTLPAGQNTFVIKVVPLISPSSGDKSVTLTVKTDDVTYNYVVGDANASATVTIKDDHPELTALSLSLITPNKGGDTGSVSVTIYGANINPGATVKLTRNGQADIGGTSVGTVQNGTSLTASFDLTGKARGAWSVVVANSDGTTATLADAFTISEGHGPDVWIDVIGRYTMRSGLTQKFFIAYGNSGDSDSQPTMLRITLPPGLSVDDDNLPSLVDGGHPLVSRQGAGEGTVLEFYVPNIPANSSTFLPIFLTIDPQLAHKDVQIQADALSSAALKTTTDQKGDPTVTYNMEVLDQTDNHLKVVVHVGSSLGITDIVDEITISDDTQARPLTFEAVRVGDKIQYIYRESVPVSAGSTAQAGNGKIASLPGVGGGYRASIRVVTRDVTSEKQDFWFSNTEKIYQRFSANRRLLILCLRQKGLLETPGKQYTDLLMEQAKGSSIVAILSEFEVSKLTGRGTTTWHKERLTAGTSSLENFDNELISEVYSSRGAKLSPDFARDFEEKTALPPHDPRKFSLEVSLLFRIIKECYGCDGKFIFQGGSTQGSLATTKAVDSEASCSVCPEIDGSCKEIHKRIWLNIVVSSDPNGKAGSQGTGEQHYLDGSEALRYDVFFENKPEASAPAQTVTVTDQLDLSKFDLSTFALGPVSFGKTVAAPSPGLSEWQTDVDLRPANNLIVRINAKLDKVTGLITWKFVSLDPATMQPTTDPLAGFLPANKNAPEGEGGVLFSVMPKQDLATGTEIRNHARIVFDVNAPIDTPDYLNTIDKTLPLSHVQPLTAAQGSVLFDVTWAGTDVGSGVAGYDVFVSENGGQFTRWLGATTVTSAQFVGKPATRYDFLSIAHDAAGNLENNKAAAEATTTTTSAFSNSIDDPRFFVRQHYLDFLSREPDSSGFAFWTDQITSCGADQACTEIKRINVSAAFYISIEFQQTGYLVERIYKASYSDATGASTLGGAHQLSVPIVRRLSEFLPDTKEIGLGVIVNQTGWETVLENNKQAFTSEFVQRSRFMTAFPTSMTPAQFVNQLFLNAGVTPSASDRTAAINEFGSATTTSDVAARSRALRRVAENATLSQQEFNRAFVLMQYFGYLRRNPNDPQDSDYAGDDFWLTKLNQFNGNYINAEMVKAFITSIEYRQRFGP